MCVCVCVCERERERERERSPQSSCTAAAHHDTAVEPETAVCPAPESVARVAEPAILSAPIYTWACRTLRVYTSATVCTCIYYMYTVSIHVHVL